MFDFSFTEIFVIAVVGLIVIGPERLPRVARTMGHLFGRMQRYVSEVKADINREMELEELRKLQSSMQDAAREIEQGVSSQVSYIENEVKEAESEARKTLDSAASEPSQVNEMSGAQAPAPDNPESEARPLPQMELGLEPDSRAADSQKP